MHGGAVVPALLHIPRVHLVLQNAVDGGVSPVGGLIDLPPVVVALAQNALVLTGAGNSLGVELLGDLNFPPPLFKEIKNPPHHLGSGGINDQMAVVSWVLLVAVAGEGPHKLAPLLFGVDGGAHLVRNVPGVLGVEDVFHGQEHVIAPLLAVHMVVDRDEPHALGGEDPLQVAAHLDVVPSKPGQVLHQNTVDPSCLDVRLHTPEGGAVKVGPSVSVVLIEPDQIQLWMCRQVLLQQLSLVGNAVALRPVAVLPGETQIARRVPSLHGRPTSFRTV